MSATQNQQQPSSPHEWPLLTVNVLAYNRLEEVRRTLLNLQSADYPRERLEIIVVDNESSDGTGDMVKREFPDVRVVRVEPNRAVAGWNAGFEAGTGDYFLVLDDDASPERGLKDAIAYLEANPKVGILACNIVGGPFTTQLMKDKQKWLGFVGCGAIIRRAVFEKIGGFAPWIHLYSHEWEYGIRTLDAGFEIRYFAACVVKHRASAIGRSSRKTVAYTTRNEMLIVHIYFRRQRWLYLLRTAFYNAWLWRHEMSAVWEGARMFWRVRSHHGHRFVKPSVQSFYARNFWSTQPFFWRVLRKAGRVSGILPSPQPQPVPETEL